MNPIQMEKADFFSLFLMAAAVSVTVGYLIGKEHGEMYERERPKGASVACYLKPDEDGHTIPRGQTSCWEP